MTASRPDRRLIGMSAIAAIAALLVVVLTWAAIRQSAMVQTARAIPALVGLFAGPTVVVIVGQNGDEPRPTGGFMGTMTRVSIDRFRVESFDVRNSRSFEKATDSPTRPPWPFEKYAGFGAWQLRDANWWPDFATSARQIDWFWQRDQGESLDAVVALTEESAIQALEALGPIPVGESGQVIDAAGLRTTILKQMYPIGDDGRPYYDPDAKPRTLGPMAEALRRRLASPRLSDVPTLIALAARLAETKGVQIWFRDAAIQDAASAVGVAGRLDSGPADSLAVIDTSISYTKIGRYLRSAISYRAEIDDTSRTVLSSVTATYANQYDGNEARKYYPPFYLTRIYDFRTDTFVDDEGVWATWLRLYVPRGAVLRGVGGLDDGPDVAPEADSNVFGGYARIGPGEVRRIRFDYMSPNTNLPGRYALRLHRQPGIVRDFEIEIRHRGRDSDSTILKTSGRLDRDRQFDVAIR